VLFGLGFVEIISLQQMGFLRRLFLAILIHLASSLNQGRVKLLSASMKRFTATRFMVT